MPNRRWILIAAAAVVLLGGLLIRPSVGLLATAPTAIATAALVWVAGWWLLPGRTASVPLSIDIPASAGIAGAASVLATVGTLLHPYPVHGTDSAGAWGSVEIGALLALHAATVRWAPLRPARISAALTGAGLSLWVLRFVPDLGVLNGVAACGFWALIAIGATVLAGYPRLAEARRHRSVAAARREQRLELARDLHDFIAHDVSGIVVQAQAAAFVAESDPQQAILALKRIEAAGLQALQAMDRTVQMLHEEPDPQSTRTPVPGIAELTGLVAGFTTPIHLDLDAGLEVPREVGSTIYRIVVEALTNVRRHARGADHVAVAVHAAGNAVTVTVTNDLAGAPPASGRRGGFGLIGLAERVEALGGTLHAGEHPDGWQVMAALPVGAAPQ